LLRLARFSAVFALIIGIAWLATETTVIAGADGVKMTLHAVPVVALRTQFGEWLLLRLALILVALLIFRSGYVSAVIGTLLAAAALAVQPMLGHAGAIDGSVGATLIISEIIHLLAAGAWLGGLLPCSSRSAYCPTAQQQRRAATSHWGCGGIGLGHFRKQNLTGAAKVTIESLMARTMTFFARTKIQRMAGSPSNCAIL
jgi:putative copper export protein